MDSVEEISPEFPRKKQDEQEATSEASWNATEGKEEDGWRVESGGETETPETIVLWNEVEGVPMTSDGDERVQAKSSRVDSEGSGEEGEEVKSPKRKVIRVEPEETQDHVREAKDPSQEEAEDKFRTERDQRSAKALVSV